MDENINIGYASSKFLLRFERMRVVLALCPYTFHITSLFLSLELVAGLDLDH